MENNKLYQFADKRVFIDTGKGCGNACKYCYLDDAAKPQHIFGHTVIHECIEEIFTSSEFKPGKTGTIISFCPHTEPFKSMASTEILLYTMSKLAPYKNLMQLATKEIIPDRFIAKANEILDDGQLTVFISVASLNKQSYLEPFASDFHNRFENINKLYGSKIKRCVYLKPFLFEESEFEKLSKLIIEVRPDAVCIGIVYAHLTGETTELYKHPTEENLLSKGTSKKMFSFFDIIKQTNIPVHFTSTCAIAQLNQVYNNVLIPQELCISCNEECVKRKWGR